jgi:hypothetical protein
MFVYEMIINSRRLARALHARQFRGRAHTCRAFTHATTFQSKQKHGIKSSLHTPALHVTKRLRGHIPHRQTVSVSQYCKLVSCDLMPGTFPHSHIVRQAIFGRSPPPRGVAPEFAPVWQKWSRSLVRLSFQYFAQNKIAESFYSCSF